jgi:hypothetical protein
MPANKAKAMNRLLMLDFIRFYLGFPAKGQSTDQRSTQNQMVP